MTADQNPAYGYRGEDPAPMSQQEIEDRFPADQPFESFYEPKLYVWDEETGEHVELPSERVLTPEEMAERATDHLNRITALETENAALREALEGVKRTGTTEYNPMTVWQRWTKAVQIATAALSRLTSTGGEAK